MDDRFPSDLDEIPEELIHLVKPELQPGERLLWASRAGQFSPRPSPWPSMATSIWFLGFASIAVACLFVLPAGAQPRRPDPDPLLVFGFTSGLFAAVIALFYGVGLLTRKSGRRKLEGQVYALTDRRAVIWVPTLKSAVSVHTFQRGTIRGEQLHRVQYPDGSGDVLFQGHYYGNPSGFLGIAEVRKVEELVRRFLVDPNRKPESIIVEFPD